MLYRYAHISHDDCIIMNFHMVQGGDILLSVTSDNQHTIYVWRWMTQQDKFCKATYIPGWYYGPEKKLQDLQSAGLFYKKKTADEVCAMCGRLMARLHVHACISNYNACISQPGGFGA